MTLTYSALGALLAVAVGLAARFGFARAGFRDHEQINPAELVVGSLLCALLVVPLVTGVGMAIAKSQAATYHEWWSSTEKSADVQVTTCTRDGACQHEYRCDPWTTWTTDSKGHMHAHTHYHSCPYTDAEYTYTVSDEMGQTYTLGDHWFPADPGAHEWRPGDFGGFFGQDLPDVSSGVPTRWAAAKARIDSGQPGGTTIRKDYKNVILAAKDDIYAKSSDAIGRYVKAGQLPKVTTEVHDYYLADKAYFVGPIPTGTSREDWEAALMRLDGDLGTQRQGDLHLVVVTDPTVTDPDDYTSALAAYWQSDALGKDTLSKNGLGVVVGVTGGTVTWARAFTGMPAGNEALLVHIRGSLPGAEATPAGLLDDGGALRALVLAEHDGFTRVPMHRYEYLFAEVQPSLGAKILVLLVGLLASCLVWGAFFAVDFRFPEAWVTAVREARHRTQPTPSSDPT